MIEKIDIRVRLNTDGDFHIAKEFRDDNSDVLKYYDGTYIFKTMLDANDYPDPKLFKKDVLMKSRAKNVLENILVNLRFSATKYYLIPSFYSFFEQAIEAINKYPDSFDETGVSTVRKYTREMGGNYEGSKIIILIRRKM